ncbi:MAG: hypothetical protein M1812_007682 [Candelaria pacifica]|nr:MAG: hypothetical protein M1812_007682 [Candelaria pacifica]
MAEIVGVIGSVISMIEFTDKVIKYSEDFKEAIKEIVQLKAGLESLNTVARLLQKRCENAEPNAPWLQGLYEVRGGHRDKDGKWIPKYVGALAQLESDIEEIKTALNPSKDWKKVELYQRVKWHFSKPRMKEMLGKVTDSKVTINLILALKNDETGTESLQLMKENAKFNLKSDGMQTEILDLAQQNSDFTKLHLTSIDDRFANLEKNQILEQEERKRKDAEIEREEIVKWLSPLTFIAKQEELYTLSFKETGDLLWQDPRFSRWAKGSPWHLQCLGTPGLGKTVLSSILTHHLPLGSQQRPLILSIFLDYKASSAQTLPNIIGSLLKQMIQLDENYPIPNDLRRLCQKAKRLGLTPESYVTDVRKILVAELDRYERIYLVVDAFDEFASNQRQALKKALLNLQPEKLSLVITMRPIAGETHNEEIVVPYSEVQITLEVPRKDIEQYVRWVIGVELENTQGILRDERIAGPDIPDTTPFQDICQADPDLTEQIVSTVTDKANGRFLFARLYLDSLKSQSNKRGMRKTLRTFPDNINDIHRDAMRRIEGQEARERKIAYKVLGLISHARHALSLQGLHHALAMTDFDEGEEDDISEEEFSRAMVSTKAILDATSGLVVIENNRREVRLVHRSLEDYIHNEESKKDWYLRANKDISRACLNYLDLVLPKQPKQEDYYVSRNVEYPFLQYASQYWGDHVRDAISTSGDHGSLQATAMRLINDKRRLDSCLQAAWFTNPGGPDTWDTRARIEPLHVSAWYGLSFAVLELDPDKDFVDVPESKYGQTPLMYACRKGHVDAVRHFLDRGASPQKLSARGRTPLFEAIKGHHDDVVEVFLDKKPLDLNINAIHTKEFNRTALMLATREDRSHMVKTLLQFPEIELDRQDVNGMTALYLAAKAGSTESVTMLLEAGASVDIVDHKVGRSALRCAAERNHVATIEAIMRGEYGANPNLKDRDGGTAILRAVNRGAKNAVEALMRYVDDVDLQCVDEDGQSLLHGASKNGYKEIVELLLQSGHNPDVRDKVDRTPLHLACQKGSLEVVTALLEDTPTSLTGSGSPVTADITLKDKFGRTPTRVAWEYGHTDIVDALSKTAVNRYKNKQESIPDDEKLPIWAMATQGLTKLITEAIKTRPDDLTIKEPFSNDTALHCAIIGDRFAVLNPLLETKKIPINARNKSERTPLIAASLLGDLTAIKTLLQHGADPDLKDRWDDEALALAQSNNHFSVMIELVEAGAAIDAQKIDMATLFFVAVEAGKIDAVQKLLDKGVDRSGQNKDGLIALRIASANEDVDMMRLLKSAPTVQFLDDKAIDDEKKWGQQRFVPFRSRPVVL